MVMMMYDWMRVCVFVWQIPIVDDEMRRAAGEVQDDGRASCYCRVKQGFVCVCVCAVFTVYLQLLAGWQMCFLKNIIPACLAHMKSVVLIGLGSLTQVVWDITRFMRFTLSTKAKDYWWRNWMGMVSVGRTHKDLTMNLLKRRIES